jgi:hypothetical protein
LLARSQGFRDVQKLNSKTNDREGFRSPHTVARFVLDTTDVIGRWSSPSDYSELERLRNEYRVVLAKTDVADTELDPDKNFIFGGNFMASIDLLELHGPVVSGHSRIGHSVFGSAKDEIRLERIKSFVKVRETSVRSKKHDIRDAMHIATAIRYGFSGLITGDIRLLNLDQRFSQDFGFRIFNVVDAVSFAHRLIEKQLKLGRLN